MKQEIKRVSSDEKRNEAFKRNKIKRKLFLFICS